MSWNSPGRLHLAWLWWLLLCACSDSVPARQRQSTSSGESTAHAVSSLLERSSSEGTSAKQGWVQLAAGGSHTCGRTVAGALYCFGLSGLGQLGLSSVQARLRPVRVPGLAAVHEVVTGRYFTCVREESGRAGCFGDPGQLGTALSPPTPALQWLPELRDALQLAAGPLHACAVTPRAELLCWGNNARGQLGANARALYQSTPTLVPGLNGVRGAAAGHAHTCALLASSQVVCWGMNTFGQTGRPPQDQQAAPLPFARVRDVAKVRAGAAHTCVQTRSGRVLCAGRNERGQLGRRDLAASFTPVEVAVPPARDLAVGDYHVCVCSTAGRLYCFGDNQYGQAGGLMRPSRSEPAPVELPAPCLAVTAGAAHSCAILHGGAGYCWGQNDGQLGDGTSEAHAAATPILPPSPSAAP